jgi:putative membrane protein
MRLLPIKSLTGMLAASAIVAGAAAAPLAGTRMTRDFVRTAAQTDQFEIMEATTALAQSQDAQVRSFARMMIQAHQQTTANLKQAVVKAGLEEPKPGLSGDQSAFLAALQSQRGADFDRTYLKQQMLVHHSALAVMQGYAASGDNPTIRQVAIAAVPIVTSHLQMLEKVGATLGSSK